MIKDRKREKRGCRSPKSYTWEYVTAERNKNKKKRGFYGKKRNSS